MLDVPAKCRGVTGTEVHLMLVKSGALMGRYVPMRRDVDIKIYLSKSQSHMTNNFREFFGGTGSGLLVIRRTVLC